MENAVPRRATPTLAQLAAGFAALGLRGFGGVAPQAHRVVVVERGWLTDAEFAEMLGLGQALPGPNVVNLSAMVGYRYAGVTGAVVAVASICIPSTIVAIALATLVAHLKTSGRMASAEAAVAAAAGGLVAAAGLRIATRAGTTPFTALLAAAMALAIGVFGLPLPAVLLAAIVVGFAVLRRGAR
ncbi:MAG TPA: chromate transporter [Candidatus Dormibacteraeota bacterium]|nr:chromate transporter [Candidatus Dormibacteraeota bacterium]